MDFFAGFLLPAVLLTAGGIFGWRLRFFWILHPLRTAKNLLSSASADGTTPFAALTMALAGTLGVGNIAGVATAITAGGAGAVLWMILLFRRHCGRSLFFHHIRHRRRE